MNVHDLMQIPAIATLDVVAMMLGIALFSALVVGGWFDVMNKKRIPSPMEWWIGWSSGMLGFMSLGAFVCGLL